MPVKAEAGEPPASDPPRTSSPGEREAQGRVFWAWLFTLPVIWILGATFLFGAPWPNLLLMRTSLVALGFPVLFIVGEPTFRSALRAARKGTPNADLMVASVSFVAWATGILTFFLPVPNAAGLAAIIMASYLTARHLRGRAAGP